MNKTVTLRMNQENGQWLYSLPFSEGKVTKLENGDTIESRKRALDEKYTAMDREDLNDAGYTNRASLNVKTGEVTL